jgi:glycine cleavage system transcriptional repressor
MNKVIITVLGKDRPGIISQITSILFDLDCNLENANQMILQQEFAGFFIVTLPAGMDYKTLAYKLTKPTEDMGLNIHVNPVEEDSIKESRQPGQVFLITTIGPDQKGLVARFSTILAEYQANIENLKAVFKGGDNPNENIMSYQVFIPDSVNSQKLFEALKQKAKTLNLDIRIQHKNIFDTINKI